MFIISEDILNKLLCSICHQYLSVEPVKIYRSRITRCGRCSKKDDGGIVSICEKIIRNGLFPCINRYEGCTHLLTCSEVEFHERKCVSRLYICPICSLEFTSFTFVQHYEKDHADAVLKNPVIHLPMNEEYENYWMYKENDFIYILYVRCNLDNSCFYTNAECLGPPERVYKMKQIVKYNGLQTKERYCSLVKKNAEYFILPFPKKTTMMTIRFYFDKSDVNVLKHINIISAKTNSNTEIIGVHNQYPKMFLSKEFKCRFNTYKLSPCGTKLFKNSLNSEFARNCEFCENIFPNSKSRKIFNCSCGHTHCIDCYAIRHFCCTTLARELIYPCDQSNVYQLLYFYCKWDCGYFFCGQNLRHHEYYCQKNVDPRDLPTLAAKYLNFYITNEKIQFISRSNIFLISQYDFKSNPTICVITEDYFKFVLYSSYTNNRFHFWVSHDYPKDLYYILFKINENDNSTYCCVNRFSFTSNQNILGFAVVLRKII